MKVQLVVVQGKPEGKTIPLAIPQFKIGRGEGCQLRPNNDQVSREHAMFEVGSEAVYLQDLGSRNGTDVNGKKLTAHDPYKLKNGDLVKIGPLTFAVSIEGAPVATSTASAPPSKKVGSIDDVSHDSIDAWLVSDASKEPPDRPSGVYGGETMTLETLKLREKPESRPAIPAAKAAPVPETVAEPEAEEPAREEIEPFRPDDEQEDDGIEDLSQTGSAELELEMPEDMIDESNPFYAKKKAESNPTAKKAPTKDSSDAANDILRRMMDRRRASKST